MFKLDGPQSMASGRASVRTLIFSSCSVDALIVLSTIICNVCGLPNFIGDGYNGCRNCSSTLYHGIGKSFKYLGEFLCKCNDSAHNAWLHGGSLYTDARCDNDDYLGSVARRHKETSKTCARSIYWSARSVLAPNADTGPEDFVTCFLQVLTAHW